MSQPDKTITETRSLGRAFRDMQTLGGVNMQVPRKSIFGFFLAQSQSALPLPCLSWATRFGEIRQTHPDWSLK